MRRSREDWIRAAVIALLAEGPDGVAVQPLARRLGATKGSFYWHFSSRDELLRAALERWETVTTDDMIARIEAAGGSAEQKARNLLAQVTASNERHPGQLVLMASAVHPDVAATVERVTSRRIGYVARLLREAGLTPPRARRRAVLAYAAYLGHAQLVLTTPGVLPRSDRARRAYVDEIADVLLTQVLRVRVASSGCDVTACLPGPFRSDVRSCKGEDSVPVPLADLRARTQKVAMRIAANAPLSVLAAKRTAYLSRPDMFDEAERIWAPVYHSADAQEGPAAFRDKRPPAWTGR